MLWVYRQGPMGGTPLQAARKRGCFKLPTARKSYT